MRRISEQRGFTLIEMIIVIAITGVVGSMVAVFLRTPIESYVAQDRRARLADAADTALRRVTRDLRLALPNSVRVTDVGGVFYLEFLATRSGGRYRAQGGGDILDFTVADSSFDVLGPPIAMQAGDRIAVYNLGIAGADAWAALFGHELAHFRLGHHEALRTRRQATEIGSSLVGLALSVAGVGLGGVVADATGTLVERAFSRDDERDADRLGLDIQRRAGFDGRGALRLQQALLQATHAASPGFLSTHPGGEERIARLRRLLEESPR